ncbi:glycosyltransferase family 4 protein [Nocardioides iriomotensis]|uniref:Glycosyltransferase n=1 Tax=Nocardioides iriomotensis TaxID=715784 RepID=A0A4Q5IVQ6_9ACTN|nr:glycosyltransferase family 4 protein [Nocardioides iriomotensis]RYU10074.1 glycosyltransferase [Nocardioides iriomotensis]
MRRLRAVVPAGLDDPTRPSGGNAYDRRVLDGLRRRGWVVRETDTFDGARDGALVLADGMLVAQDPSGALDVAERCRLVVLAHMSWGREHHVLREAHAVVTTSRHTRDALDLPDGRVHVVRPGVDPAPLARGSGLLSVGAVVHGKGHDVLVRALRRLDDLSWSCTVVGALDVEPDFVARLPRHDRVAFTGPLHGRGLERAYAAAGLLVLPSRHEAYGMVVTEALARGIPVVAGDVGGVREALGTTSGGYPGLLVPSDDDVALAEALRLWLTDPVLRARLQRWAADRRTRLAGWSAAVAGVEDVLTSVAGEPVGRPARTGR